MKRFCHIALLLLVVAVAACRGPRVIPRAKLVDIYTDMFMADQVVRENDTPRTAMDSLLVYEYVFEKYGYDTDDYMHSLRYYLRDPERFAKVFEEVAERLENEAKSLDPLIQHLDEVAHRMGAKRPQIDSILAPFSKRSFYAGQARMERDTSLYAALYRLVAVQEDTLMMPVDSVEARARRDSLAATMDSLKVDVSGKDTKAGKEKKTEKEKPIPGRPTILKSPEPGKPRPPKQRQLDLIETEEVAVEAEEEVAE